MHPEASALISWSDALRTTGPYYALVVGLGVAVVCLGFAVVVLWRELRSVEGNDRKMLVEMTSAVKDVTTALHAHERLLDRALDDLRERA